MVMPNRRFHRYTALVERNPSKPSEDSNRNCIPPALSESGEQ